MIPCRHCGNADSVRIEYEDAEGRSYGCYKCGRAWEEFNLPDINVHSTGKRKKNYLDWDCCPEQEDVEEDPNDVIEHLREYWLG